MKRKVLSLLLVLALTLTTLVGCSNTSTGNTASGSGSSSSSGSSDSSEKVLRVGMSNDITSLDYAFNYTIANFQVIDNINDFLLLFDEKGEMQPNLCTSWEAVDDTTYVYQIRDDAVFSDGTPMTIDDVVYSMNRIKDPETASDMNWAYANVDTIEATGDWEVTVKLTQPDACWQYIPATPGCQITSQAYCEEKADTYGNADGLAMGTGAYKVDSWTTGSEIVLTKNENYWGEEPYYDKIVYTVITDESSLALAMTSEQIDFCIPASTDLASTYQDASNCDIYSKDSISTTLLSFNCSSGQCMDANLRKAIASCVDVATLEEAQLGEFAEPGTASPFGVGLYVLDEPTWTERVDAMDSCSYDLDKAKEYLEASDYDGSTLKFVIIEGNTVYSNYAQVIQETCAGLGINIEIQKVTNSEYYAHAYGNDLDENGNRKYDMMINRWTPDYVDPAGDLTVFYDSANAGEGGANYAAYKNPAVDELLDKQGASIDNAERSELLIQSVELAAENMPYKALFYQSTFYCKLNSIDYDLPGFWLYSIAMKDFKPAE